SQRPRPKAGTLLSAVSLQPMTVLICGSPGFQIIGLFANSADAQSYAKDHSLKDWRVAEVISQAAFAENQGATASKADLLHFCRRRRQPRRPPLAKIRPGRPATSAGRAFAPRAWTSCHHSIRQCLERSGRFGPLARQLGIFLTFAQTSRY